MALSIILLCACSNKETVKLQKREFNSTSSILMVVPNNFTYNPETAESNPFMNDIPLDSVTEYAIAEFHDAGNVLRSHGIEVHVVEDTSCCPSRLSQVKKQNRGAHLHLLHIIYDIARTRASAESSEIWDYCV